MSKPLKVILIVLGSLIGLLILINLLLAPVAKHYVNHHGPQLLGRQLHVNRIKANILTGHVALYELDLKEDDESTSFLTFDTLDVSLKIRKLVSREVCVRHIILAEPHVNILQKDSIFNFTSIINHFKSDEPEDTTSTSKPWLINLNNIRLSHGKVYYADLGRNTDWNLKDLNLEVPGISFGGESQTDAGLTLEFADGGSLTTNVKNDLHSNDFDAIVELKNFAVENAEAYVKDALNVDKFSGMLNANLGAKGNLSEILKMDVHGDVALNNLKVTTPDNQVLLSTKKLYVDVEHLNLENNLFNIRNILIDGLFSHFDILKKGNNFANLIKPSSPETSKEVDTARASQPSKKMQVKVANLQVKNAALTFNDFSLENHFSFPVKNINIESKEFDLGGENSLRLGMELPHGGFAMANWRGRLDDLKVMQNISLNIKGLKLTDLSPYLIHFLGMPFVDGTFSFTSENSVRNGQVKGSNHLDLYKVEVGEKQNPEPQVKHIPIKAALYVLKDKDDKILLDVPVSGNLNNPEFSYMKAVWKTLGNLLVKVVSSPVRLAANALGTNSSQSLEFMAVDPLQFDFTSEQYSLLNTLAQVTQFDTTMVLILQQQINYEKAAQAKSVYNLKRDFYLSQHPDINGGKLQLSDYKNISNISDRDSSFVKFARGKKILLYRKAAINTIAQETYPLSTTLQEVKDLADFRNKFIKNYMVEKLNVDPRRLIVQNSTVANPPKNGYTIDSEIFVEE